MHYQEKFGSVKVVVDGQRVGTKRLSDYEIPPTIEELADDEEFDITSSTASSNLILSYPNSALFCSVIAVGAYEWVCLSLCLSAVRGPRRVNVLLRRGGKFVASHAKVLIEESALKEVVKPEEKGTLRPTSLTIISVQFCSVQLSGGDGEGAVDALHCMTRLVGKRAHLVSCTDTDKDVDFVRAYKLVDQSKLDAYAKAFAVEDTKFQGTLVNKVCSPVHCAFKM